MPNQEFEGTVAEVNAGPKCPALEIDGKLYPLVGLVAKTMGDMLGRKVKVVGHLQEGPNIFMTGQSAIVVETVTHSE